MRVLLVDDLDGSTEDVENIRISLDGANFEIDLSAANISRSSWGVVIPACRWP